MKRFEFAHVAEGIARQAGALLRGFYEKGVETEYKGDVDLVTEADRATEKLIRERLTAAFPAHGIFGEEGTRDQMESEYRWYVDPLDGTTNFAHGFPAFCVILGLERRAKQKQTQVPSQAQDRPFDCGLAPSAQDAMSMRTENCGGGGLRSAAG